MTLENHPGSLRVLERLFSVLVPPRPENIPSTNKAQTMKRWCNNIFFIFCQKMPEEAKALKMSSLASRLRRGKRPFLRVWQIPNAGKCHFITLHEGKKAMKLQKMSLSHFLRVNGKMSPIFYPAHFICPRKWPPVERALKRVRSFHQGRHSLSKDMEYLAGDRPPFWGTESL